MDDTLAYHSSEHVSRASRNGRPDCAALCPVTLDRQVVSRGVRVELTETCRRELIDAFGAGFNGGEFPLDRCVICNRPVTKGDFALEHQLFVEKGPGEADTTNAMRGPIGGTSPDDPLNVKRVRTLPRIWCYACSIENAKGHGVHRSSKAPPKTLLEHWEHIAKTLRENASDASLVSPEPATLIAPSAARLPPAAAGVAPGTTDDASAGGLLPDDGQVGPAVSAVQFKHPNFGVKRITAHLRQANGWNLSEKRVKRHMHAVYEHGALCRVGQVFDHSPAAAAGLVVGDVVVSMGGKDACGYADIKTTNVPLIRAKESIVTIVLREGEPKPLTLTLTPDVWDGAGLLGCMLHEIPNKSGSP